MFCGCSRTFSSFCATRACLASAAHASRLWYWPVAASLSSPNMRPWQLQLHRSKHIQYMIPTIIQWYYCKCKLSLKVALKERASHDNNPAVSNISQHQGILKTWCHKCRRLSHPNQGLCRESAVFRCQVPHTLSRPHTQKAFKGYENMRWWKFLCHKIVASSKKRNQITLWTYHALWWSTMLLSCFMFSIISLSA